MYLHLLEFLPGSDEARDTIRSLGFNLGGDGSRSTVFGEEMAAILCIIEREKMMRACI